PWQVAASPEAAAAAAAGLGFPVVLKLAAASLVHKTEAGAVLLNLKDGEAVMAAYRQLAWLKRACPRRSPGRFWSWPRWPAAGKCCWEAAGTGPLGQWWPLGPGVWKPRSWVTWPSDWPPSARPRPGTSWQRPTSAAGSPASGASPPETWKA